MGPESPRIGPIVLSYGFKNPVMGPNIPPMGLKNPVMGPNIPPMGFKNPAMGPNIPPMGLTFLSWVRVPESPLIAIHLLMKVHYFGALN
jgi:hypothetical protein